MKDEVELRTFLSSCDKLDQTLNKTGSAVMDVTASEGRP